MRPSWRPVEAQVVIEVQTVKVMDDFKGLTTWEKLVSLLHSVMCVPAPEVAVVSVYSVVGW